MEWWSGGVSDWRWKCVELSRSAVNDKCPGLHHSTTPGPGQDQDN